MEIFNIGVSVRQKSFVAIETPEIKIQK